MESWTPVVVSNDFCQTGFQAPLKRHVERLEVKLLANGKRRFRRCFEIKKISL